MACNNTVQQRSRLHTTYQRSHQKQDNKNNSHWRHDSTLCMYSLIEQLSSTDGRSLKLFDNSLQIMLKKQMWRALQMKMWLKTLMKSARLTVYRLFLCRLTTNINWRTNSILPAQTEILRVTKHGFLKCFLSRFLKNRKRGDCLFCTFL